MKRLVGWLLLAAVLFLVGIFPGLAAAIGAAVGLGLSGGLALLLQPSVLTVALLVVAWRSVRSEAT
ncbi:hypothetical protein [Streptomyces spectabilis]|uniref:Uncharacterized protein n=1 Tax=Streptomyces spectabilis TaxID=68270 RepID=A0A5P2X6B8_STRST|nr:hypothetical protein [Streptomyces spectabilis]MBB5108326.1 hypothetical protein [Streptomyces spectabilis]MCI3901085.1 hypothetical protein [Streptomyces spectabilis]QEV58580.1 hypothetical protein CP982_07515 [Streptomyces spectabilis]GGV45885.1 hypothetical protein GCM10010245_71880 [Streptomyces spectabilis]